MALSLFDVTFSGVNGTEALFLIQRFAVEPWQLGALLVGVGVSVAAVQALGVRRLVPRHGERAVAAGALSVQALASLATFLAPGVVVAFPIILVRNAASEFVFPALGALVSAQVGDRGQGELLGVTTALASVMSVLGPLGAGVVHDHVMPGAAYWMGAILLAAAAALTVRLPVSVLAASGAAKAQG